MIVVRRATVRFVLFYVARNFGKCKTFAKSYTDYQIILLWRRGVVNFLKIRNTSNAYSVTRITRYFDTHNRHYCRRTAGLIQKRSLAYFVQLGKLDAWIESWCVRIDFFPTNRHIWNFLVPNYSFLFCIHFYLLLSIKTLVKKNQSYIN